VGARELHKYDVKVTFAYMAIIDKHSALFKNLLKVIV
jgi:hypothetical protein